MIVRRESQIPSYNKFHARYASFDRFQTYVLDNERFDIHGQVTEAHGVSAW